MTNPNLVPFTQLDAPLAGSRIIGQKKRFFANNMHHQQGALIIGSENAEQVLRRPSRNSTPKKVHLIQSNE